MVYETNPDKMRLIQRFRESLPTEANRATAEALKQRTLRLVGVERWRAEWKASGLPERAWLAEFIRGATLEDINTLLWGWPNGGAGVDKIQLAGIVVQHAQIKELSPVAIIETAARGDLVRLMIRIDELDEVMRGEAVKWLGRRVMYGLGQDETAFDLLKKILEEGRYENKLENIWPIASLGWAGRSCELWRINGTKIALLRKSAQELGVLLKWEDSMVWEALLKAEQSRESGAIVYRISPWRDGEKFIGHHDWCKLLGDGDRWFTGSGIHTTPANMLPDIAVSTTPLIKELEKVINAGHKELLNLLFQQLSEGEPAEALVKPLAKISPVLVESLRQWCHTPTDGPRPRLSTIEEKQGEWQRLLVALDDECGIVDPEVRTRELPKAIGAPQKTQSLAR